MLCVLLIVAHSQRLEGGNENWSEITASSPSAALLPSIAIRGRAVSSMKYMLCCQPKGIELKVIG